MELLEFVDLLEFFDVRLTPVGCRKLDQPDLFCVRARMRACSHVIIFKD